MQLGPASNTRPRDAQVFRVPVQADDILILASDGLGDCDTYVQLEPPDLAVVWANVLHAELAKEATTEINFALSLLRAALGGSDERLVSRNMTVEMDDRWMDDTTIIVQRIQNQSRQYK